jgi:aspartate carbamoyltransferase catalytic subunit
LNLDIERSSTVKGETEVDTVMNLAAMGVHGFIIRHKQNGIVRSLAETLGPQYVVINAGCGTMEHPTQALLDMLTIQQTCKDFSALTVAIIGDLRHSRVAHSDIAALLILGVKQIRLIGPSDFMPPLENHTRICVTDDIKMGLKDVDVIITLRVQKERIDKSIKFDPQHFFEQFGLTQSRLQYAKPNAIVMHPGPMNRGVEIDDTVANGPQSVILKQVHNGVAIRMAILQHLFSTKESSS